MKATLEKLEKNTVAIEVEIDAERFGKACDQAAKKLAGKVNIPGFRKGKVPRRVLEIRLGKEVLWDEALELVVPEAYYQAVAQTAIEPIDQPKIDVVQVGDNQPLVFKATVEVKPEVTLGDYKGLKVDIEPREVTDADVEAQLANLQSRHAQLQTLEEGEAQMGDMTTIDFEGFKDGVPFEGGKGEGYPLELGSGTFIPGFEEQIVGKKIGETFDVNVTFPADYHVPELAGAPAVFKVTLQGIKRKKLAPLDDEFAKDVSEFETLDELKKDIRANLELTYKQQTEEERKNRLVQQAADNATVEIPPVMVENRINSMLEDFERRLKYQGLDIQSYYHVTGKTEAQLREEMKANAEQGVKTDLVLEAIAKAENLSVEEADLDQEIARLAEQVMQPVDVLKAYFAAQGNMAGLKEGILLDKAVRFLVENSQQ